MIACVEGLIQHYKHLRRLDGFLVGAAVPWCLSTSSLRVRSYAKPHLSQSLIHHHFNHDHIFRQNTTSWNAQKQFNHLTEASRKLFGNHGEGTARWAASLLNRTLRHNAVHKVPQIHSNTLLRRYQYFNSQSLKTSGGTTPFFIIMFLLDDEKWDGMLECGWWHVERWNADSAADGISSAFLNISTLLCLETCFHAWSLSSLPHRTHISLLYTIRQTRARKWWLQIDH